MTALQKLKDLFTGESEHPALRGWAGFDAGNEAPDWVKAEQKRAHDHAAFAELPHPKMERYKYTNIAAAVKDLSLTFGSADVQLHGPVRFTTPIAEALHNPPEWLRQMILQRPAGEDFFGDMMLWQANTAYLRDGFVLDVPPNMTGEMPLNVTITGHDGAYFVPRTFLRIGANSEFTLIERHVGNGKYWNNRVTQIHLEPGARLRHYRIQDNSTTAVYTQNTHVTQDRDSTYEAFVLTTGAALSRNQIHVELQGPNAEVRLAGVNLLNGGQHGDTTITIEHQAPHCKSNQTYKTILDARAHGVFQGKVHVHRPAQLTDGYQLSNAMLLSDTAIMDTKPELEIYADDVKCSHGSTTGQIDTGPMFYLRSRGLTEAQAKLLLTQAFIGPALDEIRDDEAREMMSETTLDWLQENVG